MNETLPIADAAQRTLQDAGNYHIEAAESLVERVLRTLKHEDLFAVFDQHGNLQSGPSGPDGIYYRDTRHLSHFHLTLGGSEPMQLGSVLLDNDVGLAAEHGLGR